MAGGEITDPVLKENLTQISKYDSEAWQKIESMYLATVDAINTQMPNGLIITTQDPMAPSETYTKEDIIGFYTTDFINLTKAMLDNYAVKDDELRDLTDDLIEGWYAHNSLARRSQPLPSQTEVDDSEVELTPVYQSLNEYKDKLKNMPPLGYWAGPNAKNNTEVFNADIEIIKQALDYKKQKLKEFSKLYDNSVQSNMTYLMFNTPHQLESDSSFTQQVAKDEAKQKYLDWCKVHDYKDYVKALTD